VWGNGRTEQDATCVVPGWEGGWTGGDTHCDPCFLVAAAILASYGTVPVKDGSMGWWDLTAAGEVRLCYPPPLPVGGRLHYQGFRDRKIAGRGERTMRMGGARWMGWDRSRLIGAMYSRVGTRGGKQRCGEKKTLNRQKHLLSINFFGLHPFVQHGPTFFACTVGPVSEIW